MYQLLYAKGFVLLAALFAGKNAETVEQRIIGRWAFVSITSSKPMVWTPGTAPSKDGTALMQECEKDDFVQFKPGGVYEENEGETRCDDSDSPVYTSTWSLEGSDMMIDGKQYQVVAITDTEMKVAQTVEAGRKNTVTVTVTMKRK
ncbi:lipocalin family protein [uncultured Chitinophaga sp.]|uniref:lipocalin family protein n=1 Tax=uncultured Chitinophaga sp. TaxID=339340 RepID=UPI0025CEABAC|nr:lipocalin family protein [uncultured Chitinophaga sp.]